MTWADLARNPSYRGFRIYHNVSDDFQQFISLWRGAECRIEHNTIIRRRVNANEWGVFNITQHDSKNLVRNNIVVTEKDVVIFNVGKNGTAKPNTVIANNLYHAMAGQLRVGLEGPGENAVFDDPQFIHYARGEAASDFALRSTSPVIRRGIDLGYATDHAGTRISQNAAPDIGAFEHASTLGD